MSLLASIIEQLQDSHRAAKHIGDDLNFIDAVFKTKRGRRIGEVPVADAMGYLVDDVYRFEDFDLSDAASVVVESH
jgi:hypothetical protein